MFKAGPEDAPTPEVVECVRRELLGAGGSALSPDDSLAIVTRALSMLDAVGHLLEALSPAEVQATAERAHLGRLADVHAGYWRVFSARHRVLTDVFATQRSTFADRARAFFEQRGAPCEGPLADDRSRKGRP
jgi:hypothetical protein